MANEKRLIDAYKLEDLLRSNIARYHNKDDVIAAIAGQPTVDAVEVVRCKDCKYFRKGRPLRHECKKVGGGMCYPTPNDFCSYGERREGE